VLWACNANLQGRVKDIITETDYATNKYRRSPRSTNCIRKTKNTFCETRVYVPLPKFCEKLFPRTKFHWNRQSAAELWPKRFLKWRPSAILNFKNFHIWSCDCHRVQICIYVPNFIDSKSDDFFVEVWRFHDFQNGGSSPSWILWVQ